MGDLIHLDSRRVIKPVQVLSESNQHEFDQLCLKDVDEDLMYGGLCGCPKCTRENRKVFLVCTGIVAGIIALGVYIIFFFFRG